jgi:hypothetical protein
MTCCCFPFLGKPMGRSDYRPMLNERKSSPVCSFLSRMWTNIKSDEKLSITIGAIAIAVGVAGLIFSLGMSSILSGALIAGGSSLITKSLCDAVPNCGDEDESEYDDMIDRALLKSNSQSAVKSDAPETQGAGGKKRSSSYSSFSSPQVTGTGRSKLKTPDELFERLIGDESGDRDNDKASGNFISSNASHSRRPGGDEPD